MWGSKKYLIKKLHFCFYRWFVLHLATLTFDGWAANWPTVLGPGLQFTNIYVEKNCFLLWATLLFFSSVSMVCSCFQGRKRFFSYPGLKQDLLEKSSFQKTLSESEKKSQNQSNPSPAKHTPQNPLLAVFFWVFQFNSLYVKSFTDPPKKNAEQGPRKEKMFAGQKAIVLQN